MKNNLVFLFPLILVMASCTTDQKDSTVEFDSSMFSAKNFTNAIVAYEKDGEAVLGVTPDEIVDSFNDFADKMKLGLEDANTYELISIDENRYIRFYMPNGTSSTVELVKDQQTSKNRQIMYMMGETVCTSTSCSSCCGCVPNGQYCTPCRPNGPTGMPGDCTRTTTGDDKGDT